MIEELARDCFSKLLEILNDSAIDDPDIQYNIEVKLVRVIELSKAFEIYEIPQMRDLDERATELIRLSQYSMKFDPEICNKISTKNIE